MAMLGQQLRYLVMYLPLSRTRGTPVLEVRLHSQDGTLKYSDTWTADPQGMWTRSCVGSS